MPDFSSLPAKVVAYFQHRVDSSGFWSFNPMISIHTIVPADSEVFRVIEEGDLEGLVRLFQNGEASLRDCDPRGRSLLAVSCTATLL